MRTRLLIILTIIISGCKTSSELKTEINLSENNKDVFILSTLIQDHFRRTNTRTLDLEEIIKNDSLSRICGDFENIQLELHGGYICVYYNFSDSRKFNIELNNQEQEKIKWVRWKEKELKVPYDGEIQFEYGERFFKLKKIILKI